MAQDANQILKQILGVCVKINNKLGDKDTDTSKGSAGILSKDFGKTPKDDIKSTANSIKGLMAAINELNKSNFKSKKIDATSKSLKGLFETIIFIGKKERTIERAIKLFNSLSRSLNAMTRFTKAFSGLLLSMGVSILMIAGSIAAAGLLLGTRGKPLATLAVLSGVLLGMVGVMYLLGKAERIVEPGIKTAKGFGTALLFLSGGLLAFVISLQLISSLMKAGNDAKSLIVGMGTIVLIIGAMGGIFGLLGLFEPVIKKGTSVAVAMAIGMVALGAGVYVLALAAKYLTSLGNDQEAVRKRGKHAGEQKGKFGQLMSAIGPGLGTMGIIIVSSALLFAAMGAFALPIIGGVAVALGMSLALVTLAVSVKKMIKITDTMDTTKIEPTVSELVGGVLKGLISGVGGALSGGQKGLKGFAAGIKNSAILYSGIGILMGVSLALSMFAKAMTAFVDLGNMRVIKGYKKDGEPIFGENVDIRGVGKTVTATIGQFLTGLLTSTEGLTKTEAKAIKKMARALTGRRGILSGVIQFADVLKTFSQFGPEGKIGFVEMIPSGTDEDGNPIFKQVPKTVLISEVVNNIIDSFGQFVTQLTSHADDFGVSGKEGRRMKKLSSALTGRRGILNPIIEFTKALEAYAKYGSEGVIPILDENGEPVMEAGKPKTVPIEQIAKNVAKTLSSFSTSLALALEGDTGKEAKRAEENIKKFQGLIKQLDKLSQAQDGLDRTSASINILAASIANLSTSLVDLNVDKLETVTNNAWIGSTAKKLTSTTGKSTGGNVEYNTFNSGDSGSSNDLKNEIKNLRLSLEKWQEGGKRDDELAIQIGNQVAAAFKNGQFHFEFGTDKSGVLSFE